MSPLEWEEYGIMQKRIAELDAENAKLMEENSKLRALVERGANLLTDVCKSQDKFIWDCKEALK